MMPRFRLGVFVLALFGPAAFGGCDSDVTPVLGTDQPFTLYGVLSPQLDTQRVIVFPIEDRLEPLSGEPIDATVSWLHTGTGAETVWQDSILRQPDGSFVPLYWLPAVAAFGTTYDVRVQDSEGRVSHATVAVPAASEVEIQTPSSFARTVIPVLVRGDVPQLLKVELEYGFDYTQSGAGEKLESLVLPYDTQASRVAEGWLIQVNLSRDYQTVLDFIRSQRAIELARGVQLLGIQLRFLAANAEWSPPGGVFDPEILVQPGVMTNVQNGFGFVGAGYRVARSWLPADSTANAAGFRQDPEG
jgi:hypothetical protein